MVGRGLVAAPGTDEQERYVQLLDDGPSGVATVVRTGAHLVVEDAATCTELRRDHVERWNVASCLFAPLTFGGAVREVAILIEHEPRTYTDGEVAFVLALAEQAATGLALRELERRRRIEGDQQSALARAAKMLNASLDLREVLAGLCREADTALGGDVACVYLGDADHGGTGVASHNAGPDWLGHRMKPGEGVAGKVFLTREAAVSNAYQDEPGVPASRSLSRVETAVSVPICSEGELRGALSVGFNRMRHVTDEDLHVLEAIADLAALACQNAEAFERAQVAARTDSLTGVLNHGAMQVRLAEEIARARRDAAPLACLLLDLDDFKALNDRAGHLVGDQVLQCVAGALAEEFRVYDQIARYGGDEFAVILTGLDADEARTVAERVRLTVRAAGGTAGASLGTSIGIAQWREPQTSGELLERADRALLLAKRMGKHRVAVSSAQTEHDLALMQGRGDASSSVMREFWDLMSGFRDPREALIVMPSFTRRVLGLEEVALYEAEPGIAATAMHRLAIARLPGDPAPRAFRRATLTGAELLERLEAGVISRSSLAELHEAMGVASDGLDA
ncbi:MAG: sensor domain-containing diguanylate cyclase [Solirubrobacteraceae bacterium]